jgi:fluoride ion exporter CrcB/FEX
LVVLAGAGLGVLARDGARWMGLAYVTGSVVLGYIAVWMGAALLERR